MKKKHKLRMITLEPCYETKIVTEDIWVESYEVDYYGDYFDDGHYEKRKVNKSVMVKNLDKVITEFLSTTPDIVSFQRDADKKCYFLVKEYED